MNESELQVYRDIIADMAIEKHELIKDNQKKAEVIKRMEMRVKELERQLREAFEPMAVNSCGGF